MRVNSTLAKLCSAFILATFTLSANSQNIISLAGVGQGMINAGFSGDGGPASLAQLNVPFDITHDAQGNIYISDKLNSRIRKIDIHDTITTIAGTGVNLVGPDGGQALLTAIGQPGAITMDDAGNLYFADGNHNIRKIDANGIITTIAGAGTPGFSGDGGPATLALLNGPEDVVVDTAGNIYIADRVNHRVRMIDGNGIITTIAGDGTPAFTGDGGAAAAAQLNLPMGLALSPSGELYIADGSNRRVRKIDANGIITTVAGDGSTNYTDGPALSVGLRFITDLAFDQSGNMYIAEQQQFGGSKLKKLSNNTISTILNGMQFGGYNMGGPLTAAALNSLRGIDVDTAGNVLLVDPDDSRIEFISYNNTLPTTSAVYYQPGLPDNTAVPFTSMQHCNIICTYRNLSVIPINENVAYKVMVDANVNTYQGAPYVQRHYDIEPFLFATTDSAMVTLYFTQAEFDAYNGAAGPNFEHLPTSASDAAGISWLRVDQYHGVATGPTPGDYPGTHQVIDPIDLDVIYNIISARWEVTFKVVGFSGFFVSTPEVVSVAGVERRPTAMSVYPSITSDEVYIELAGSALSGTSAVLTTLQGATVQHLTLNAGKQSISLRDLAPGMYLLRSASGEVHKIIKQ